jgi:Transglycosylase SLT domain
MRQGTGNRGQGTGDRGQWTGIGVASSGLCPRWDARPAPGVCEAEIGGSIGARCPVPGPLGGRRASRLSRTVPLCVTLLAAALTLTGVGEEAGAQYLAVFMDGRVLHVTGAQLLGTRRMLLSLPGGASLEVPATRVDRVIEDEVEEKPVPVPKPLCSPTFSDQPLPAALPYAKEIRSASRKTNLHPWLVAAVVEAESGFNPRALSRVGACGLMQLMPSVWAEQGIRRPFDVRANLQAGCRHLRGLIDRFRDLDLALAAYNAGAAVVERSHGVPPYRETRNFIRHVLASFCPPHAAASDGAADRPEARR